MKFDSFLRAVKKIIADGCICYTVITFILFSGMKLHLTLPFALLFATMHYIVLHTKKIPAVLKLILHYAVTTAILFVLIIVWGGLDLRPSTTLVIMIAYTLIYALIAGVFCAIRKKGADSKNSQTQYTSQFNKKK